MDQSAPIGLAKLNPWGKSVCATRSFLRVFYAVIKDNEKWQLPVRDEKLHVTEFKAVCKGFLKSSMDFAVIKYTVPWQREWF